MRWALRALAAGVASLFLRAIVRVFAGYGYNARDAWIESHVFPILRCAGFAIVHGKDARGLELKDEVKRRLDLCDAAIGFFTVRERQGNADFSSHIWVRGEMIYANAKGKPIVPVLEKGVKVPPALLGNPQFIPPDQNDRVELVGLDRGRGRGTGCGFLRRMTAPPHISRARPQGQPSPIQIQARHRRVGHLRDSRGRVHEVRHSSTPSPSVGTALPGQFSRAGLMPHPRGRRLGRSSQPPSVACVPAVRPVRFKEGAIPDERRSWR
jgi:hypothetical protein